jgi:hypothetical protein
MCFVRVNLRASAVTNEGREVAPDVPGLVSTGGRAN